jgi:hypothetical protein
MSAYLPTERNLTMRIENIIDLQFHTNGNEGTPFHVVLFADTGDLASRKLGIVFPEDGSVAVLDLSKLYFGNISFQSNSWRGDLYEGELRHRIEQYETACDEHFTGGTRDGAML